MALAIRVILLNLLVIFGVLSQKITAQQQVQMHKKRGIRACKFDKIYQLGDSISDTGNCIRDSFCGAHSSCSKLPYGMNYFHKPTGRCSNGLLMIDFIDTGIWSSSPKSLQGSKCKLYTWCKFCSSRATALSAQVLAKKKIAMSITNSSLSVQLDWMASHFKTTCSPDCPAQLKRSLFLVGHIGGNEINFGLSQGKTMEELRRMVPNIVQTIIHGVKRVIGFGATRILVPGNFPKGCGPAFLMQFMTNNSAAYDEYHCLKDLNNLAIFYNDHLQQAIDEMKKEYPNITLIYGDYYNAYMWLLQNAVSLGLDKNSLQKACCGIGGDYNYDKSKKCGAPGVSVCAPLVLTSVGMDSI
ncbi:acetylajmalan esterase [Capsicum chacoense]